jgi:hypothetical protein
MKISKKSALTHFGNSIRTSFKVNINKSYLRLVETLNKLSEVRGTMYHNRFL